MSTIPRIALLAAACAAASACQPAGDQAVDRTATTDADGERAPGDTALAGAFTCDDGTRIHLAWGDDDVTVNWADGRTATLPRAESASAPAGDAYVGDTVSVDRDGNRITLRDGDQPARTCIAADDPAAAGGSDAAISMRYDCDADTRITVFADDSARVALPDGQQVTLSRVAGSAPPVFTGDTLFFSIDDAGAHLSHGDQTNELSCRPA